MIIWQCIFWLCVLLIMHSYLLFPWLLQILASNKKENSKQFTADELPSLTVVMSVYNEQGVIREKLDSLFASNYPTNKLNILIGSDASEDGTGEILKEYQKANSNMKVIDTETWPRKSQFDFFRQLPAPHCQHHLKRVSGRAGTSKRLRKYIVVQCHTLLYHDGCQYCSRTAAEIP